MSVTACKNWRKSVSLYYWQLLTALSISHVNRMQTLSRTFLLQSFTERLQKVCGSTSIHSKKVKVKYVDLYSASSRSASNALPLPVSQRWSPQANPTARHQRTRETMWYWLVYHAICLFTPPATPGTHSSPGRLRLSRPGCWFRAAEVVYPSKDGHPPRH